MKNRNIKTGYLADVEAIEGLSVTYDKGKIKMNSKKLNINIPIHEDAKDCTSRITKLDDFVILTMCCGNANCIQFGIEKKLSIEELILLDEKFIPYEVKILIYEAHKLTEDITLEGLLKL